MAANKLIAKKAQQGVVLVVALIVLLVMTLVGVTLMSGATLQERMAGNNREQSIARMHAESALRQAQEWLVTNNFGPNEIKDRILTEFLSNGNAGLYSEMENLDAGIQRLVTNFDMTEPSEWNVGNSLQPAITDPYYTPPRYTIEYLGQQSDRRRKNVTGLSIDVEEKDKINQDAVVFRINSIGYGQNDNISVILSATFSTGQGASP